MMHQEPSNQDSQQDNHRHRQQGQRQHIQSDINNKQQKASVKDIARSFSQTESKESSVNTDFLKNLEDLKSEVGSQEQDLKGSVADIVSDIKENAAKVGALRDFFGIDQQEKSNDKNAKYKPPVNDLSSLDNNKELFSDLANSVGNKILECEKYDTNRPNLANNISISTGSKPER